MPMIFLSVIAPCLIINGRARIISKTYNKLIYSNKLYFESQTNSGNQNPYSIIYKNATLEHQNGLFLFESSSTLHPCFINFRVRVIGFWEENKFGLTIPLTQSTELVGTN